MDKEGKLIVISGPAGAGKGTVVKELLKDDDIRLSVSATTRQPRGKERNGVEYHFLSVEEFEKMIAEDGFIEYARYVDNYYGSPKKPVEQWLSEGKNVILEIEVQGGLQVMEKYPGVLSIFILPPSMEELERRLRGRGTESEEVIQKRMAQAEKEMRYKDKYRYNVVNDVAERAADEVLAILAENK